MVTRHERRQPVPAAVPIAAAAPAFVGREATLRTVTKTLGDGPALVLIQGEPGIGKTRLLHEVRQPEPLASRTLLLAACPPLREPFPLGPVVEGVRRLRDQLGDIELSALCGALRPLFPEWADDLPPAPEPLDNPLETRHRLLRALTELVERLGVELLAVDDAHWADGATLEWLLSLTSVADPTMSIVVTSRPTDAPRDSLLLGLTSRVPAGMTRLRVELPPLDVAQTRRLASSMVGAEEVSETFAALLHEHTDGIPLAVEECVRLLRDRHDIAIQEGTWTRRLLEELEVPPTMRDSVLERVARLPPAAQQMLEAAAVLAEPAEEALLTTVARLDAAGGGQGLAAALASGVLREARPGQFAFRHALDAQAVAGAIPASRRRTLHGRAAEALQVVTPAPVVRLARHFRESGDADAWCRYAEAAADLALDSGDGGVAVATYVDLLTTLEHPVPRRSRLARKLGNAAWRAPLGELGPRVNATLRDVLAGDGLPAGERGEIRFQLGRLLATMGEVVEEAFAQLEAGLPDLEDNPGMAAGAMLSLAFPLTTEWPASRHQEWLRRATELLPRLESPSEKLSFLVRYGPSLLLLGEESGWQAAESIPHSSESERERREIAIGLLNVAQCAAMWGRYADARRWLATATDLIKTLGLLRVMDTARAAEAHLDWRTGAWDGLDEAAADLADSEHAQPTDALEARYIQGMLDLARGSRRLAEQRLREVHSGLEQRGHVEPFFFPSAGLARISLAEAAPKRALSFTTPSVDVIARKEVWVWATDIAPVHVEALARSGRVEQAEALAGKLARDLEGRHAPALSAALLLCRALIADARGDHAGGAQLFAEAAAAWAALPRPYDHLLARERQGQATLAASDPDAALELLTDTEHRLRELGARWDADRVAQVLREHGVEVSRAWRQGPRGYGDDLTPREQEVLALVATGMTNRRIGEVLFLSPKTVGVHLSAAMRKLGVSSRTAAAMAAADAGMIARS